MKKLDQVLDILDNPGKYDGKQLAEIFADPETKELYNVLSKTYSVIEQPAEVDVVSEWKSFAARYTVDKHRPWYAFLGSRAASITVIVLTSIAAVTAGVVLLKDSQTDKSEKIAVEKTEKESVVEVAPAPLIQEEDEIPTLSANSSIMFEDEPLSFIIKTIGKAYGIAVEINNPATAELHLYYNFDPSHRIEDVIDQLNTFDRINIELLDNTLILN